MDTQKQENAKKPETTNKRKPDVKKPGKPSGPPEGRGRAKSTLVNPFDNKKPLNLKKESKPIEVIEKNRFASLLSMFDKKPAESQVKPEESGPKKLDMGKFSAFNKDQKNTGDNQNEALKRNTISDSIKQRMDALMNANKSKAPSTTYIDPVLEERKKLRENDGGDDDCISDDYDYDDNDNDNDDHISEENDNNRKKSDSWSDSDDNENDNEKEKEGEKMTEKVTEKVTKKVTEINQINGQVNQIKLTVDEKSYDIFSDEEDEHDSKLSKAEEKAQINPEPKIHIEDHREYNEKVYEEPEQHQNSHEKSEQNEIVNEKIQEVEGKEDNKTIVTPIAAKLISVSIHEEAKEVIIHEEAKISTDENSQNLDKLK